MCARLVRFARALVAVLLVMHPAEAQIHRWQGGINESLFGYSVDGLGDVDGDGHDDVVVGQRWGFIIGCQTRGSSVRAYSGRTGEELYCISAPDCDHLGDLVRGIGDWNADGTPDFVAVNAPDIIDSFASSKVTVHDGATGSTLATFVSPWPWYDVGPKDAAGAGDVDADGFADIVFGIPDDPLGLGGNPNGRARVYSGQTGALVREFVGSSVNEELGRWVGGVGDWNGDGRDDVAISATNGPTRVYSVVDGAILFEIDATGDIQDPDDFDGDGQRDLLVGDTVHSGASGAPLLVMTGWTTFHPGQDYDGDGRLDFVAGDPAYGANRGRAAILSGADGSILVGFPSNVMADDRFGHEVAVADVDADGLLDAIVGAPRDLATSGPYGYVEVWSGCAAAQPQTYCIAAPNSAGPGAEIGFEGSSSLAAADLTLLATACPPNHSGIFYYGPSAAQVPFGNGLRCVTGQTFRLWPPISTGASGTASLALDFASPPLGSGPGAAAAGSTWRFQFWYRDIPAGGAQFNLTDALAITFCP